mmetsp:Transcript_14006/g.41741  ORF Transcript_14006/g.41741 Transcript_14006/m.41741 type:complete len:300 (-) Transcript_14006:86-985(-)
MRKRSAPLSRSMISSHPVNSPRSTSPCTSIPKEVTVWSCTCSPSVSRNSGSISSVRLRSKAPIPSTCCTDTWEFCDRMMGANLLMARRRPSTRLRSPSSGTRSILFSKRRSAKATCSSASFSAPSGFSSSRCCSMCLASTSVTMPSSSKTAEISSSTKKVCATGAGSAMPVVSMMMASSALPDSWRALSFLSTMAKSARTVQQMQPFIISMSSSPSTRLAMFFWRSASSMPTSPNSFSITAMVLPCSAVRMWLSSVVLPLPRKPVSTVTGTRMSTESVCAAMVLPEYQGDLKTLFARNS